MTRAKYAREVKLLLVDLYNNVIDLSLYNAKVERLSNILTGQLEMGI